MIKNIFLQMVANVMHWYTSHVQNIQEIFNSFKWPYPSYLVLKFGSVLPSTNQNGPTCDFAKVMT